MPDNHLLIFPRHTPDFRLVIALMQPYQVLFPRIFQIIQKLQRYIVPVV
jgi:hypothetical protein